jgi:putative ABC transport system permease protein
MLVGQYSIVMFVIILAVGISKQVSFIKNTQVGGNDSTILVLNEQPDQVKMRYKILKEELEKHPEIKGVTAAMQLPGSAIRDMIGCKTRRKNEGSTNSTFSCWRRFSSVFQYKAYCRTEFSAR